MKKYFLNIIILIALGFTSCQQENIAVPENSISQEETNQIKALGFSAKDVIKMDDGYIVEGDIFIPKNDLSRKLENQTLRVGEEEQYHTTQLVTGLPRVIKVALDKNMPASYGPILDEALRRYNAENLQITFKRVDRKQDILFFNRDLGSGILGSAGFPTPQGYAYPLIFINDNFIKTRSFSFNALALVFAHEIGHCIGFRHTDYMNRSFSCTSGGGNEGDGGVGAIHIPGTPTGPDANSWMLSCLGSLTVNRPFNANDKIALAYLY